MGQEYLPNRVGLAAGVTLGLSDDDRWLADAATRIGCRSLRTKRCDVPAVYRAPLFAFALSLTLRETAVLLHPVAQSEASQHPRSRLRGPGNGHRSAEDLLLPSSSGSARWVCG